MRGVWMQMWCCVLSLEYLYYGTLVWRDSRHAKLSGMLHVGVALLICTLLHERNAFFGICMLLHERNAFFGMQMSLQ